jgi:outer membrane receptor for ferrienterochelin and colicin
MTAVLDFPFANRFITCVTAVAMALFAVANAQVDDATDEIEEIVVTGYTKSLEYSTEFKRNSVGFVDAIFVEDIGKYPDTNIAESFNRIPGITITREITGEGLNVAIRGLGTNFTRVLLNDAPIWVASTGRTDAQSVNITDEDQRSYFQFGTAAVTSYSPGRQILFGLRGSC